MLVLKLDAKTFRRSLCFSTSEEHDMDRCVSIALHYTVTMTLDHTVSGPCITLL
jgi:hypothetical protein